MSIVVAPIVIGALGSAPLDLSKLLKFLDFDDTVISLPQKTVLLGTILVFYSII